jgi:metallo-beta-lactamase class B
MRSLSDHALKLARMGAVLALFAIAPACIRPGAPASLGNAQRRSAALDLRPDDVRLASDVLVRRLAPGLWLHVTLGPGEVPANGILLETPDGGTVLFDSGWNDRHAVALADWARDSLRRPVRRAVYTHSHSDRAGGHRALAARGIPASSLALTSALVAREITGVAAPDSVPGLTAAPVRDAAGFELLFPGHGHTPDNIVVYFPAQRVLHGGCLVKSDTATTTGNVADADVGNWPLAVARVRRAYPEVRVVVPGHGAIGGPSALSWTERLIAEKGPADKAGAPIPRPRAVLDPLCSSPITTR